MMRPRSAGFLGFAAVLPEARGLGTGSSARRDRNGLGSRRRLRMGAVDWRSTNLQANRAWTALGFKPTFHRLHRAIV